MLKTIMTLMSFALLLGPVPAVAQQYTYASGEAWAVTQDLPSAPVAENGDRPTCNLSTQIWDDKGLDIQYVLTSHDMVELWVRVHSDSWKLPVGRATDIMLKMIGGDVLVAMTAVKEDVLSGPIQRDRGNPDNYMIVDLSIQAVMNTRGRGVGFRVQFPGNEPIWPISAPVPFEAYQIKAGLDKCIADLRRKAASFYPDAGDASGEPTSPFAEGPDAKQLQLPKPREEMTMTDFLNRKLVELKNPSWTFEKTTDEEYGPEPICRLDAEQDGIQLGFQATSSKSFSAYFDGFLKSEGTTTWSVDDSRPSSIDFVFDGYLEKYVSKEFPPSLKDQVLGGNTLEIAGGKGDRLTITLRGMREAARQFNKCLAEVKSDTSNNAQLGATQTDQSMGAKAKSADVSASHESDAFPVGSQRIKGCRLRVDGKDFFQGECLYSASADDSFQIEANGYFAQISVVSDTSALGFWNEDANATHAHSTLGELTKSGSCWQNARALICADLAGGAASQAQNGKVAEPSTANNDGFWVVVGSSPEEAVQSATVKFQTALKKCGHEPFGDFSVKFSGFTPGYVVFVLGAYTTKAEASAVQRAVRQCAPDAYVKEGRYAGE